MTEAAPPATMAEDMTGVPDSPIAGHVFKTLAVSAPPNDMVGIGAIRRAGRDFLKVKQTCSRIYALWNRRLITEHGDGKWLFVQYDDKVLIFEVKTMQLQLGNGDSGIERMRIYLQEVCPDCIATCIAMG